MILTISQRNAWVINAMLVDVLAQKKGLQNG